MMEIRVSEGNEVKWIPSSSLCVPHVGTPKLHRAEALKHPALACPSTAEDFHVQASSHQAAVSCCEQQAEGAGSALPLPSQEPPPAALHLHPQGHGAAAGAHGGAEENHKDAPRALEPGWESWGCSPGEGRPKSSFQCLKELIRKMGQAF